MVSHIAATEGSVVLVIAPREVARARANQQRVVALLAVARFVFEEDIVGLVPPALTVIVAALATTGARVTAIKHEFLCAQATFFRGFIKLGHVTDHVCPVV